MKKNLKKKLTLNKATIAQLNNFEMDRYRAAGIWTTGCSDQAVCTILGLCTDLACTHTECTQAEDCMTNTTIQPEE